MKITVVSYSMTGNNHALAKCVAAAVSAAHIKIDVKKKRSMLSIFADLLLNRIPDINPRPDTLSQPDLLLMFGPVWVGKVATPLRAYLRHIKKVQWKYAFVSICGGSLGPSPKIAVELEKRTGCEPVAALTFPIVDLLPQDPKPGIKETSHYKLTAGDLKNFTDEVRKELKI